MREYVFPGDWAWVRPARWRRRDRHRLRCSSDRIRPGHGAVGSARGSVRHGARCERRHVARLHRVDLFALEPAQLARPNAVFTARPSPDGAFNSECPAARITRLRSRSSSRGVVAVSDILGQLRDAAQRLTIADGERGAPAEVFSSGGVLKRLLITHSRSSWYGRRSAARHRPSTPALRRCAATSSRPTRAGRFGKRWSVSSRRRSARTERDDRRRRPVRVQRSARRTVHPQCDEGQLRRPGLRTAAAVRGRQAAGH